MLTIKQSSSSSFLVFFMADSTDHVTGKTGLSPTVLLSKNGGSFASPAGAVSEIGNGFYRVAGNATDTNTLGVLALSATASGADQAAVAYPIVAYDPADAAGLGLSRMDVAVSTRNATTPPTAVAIAYATRGELATELARVDVAVSSRLAAAGYTAPANSDVASIKAKTDNLPASPAAVGSAMTLTPGEKGDIAAAVWGAGTRTLTSSGSGGATAAEVWSFAARELTGFSFTVTTGDASSIAGIKAKTDNLPTFPAAAGDAMTALVNFRPPTLSEAQAHRDTLLADIGALAGAIDNIEAGGGASAADIADAVWNEALAGHATAGSAGAQLAAAGAGGDPWATLLPGSYVDGTAGAAVGRLSNTPPDAPVIVIPDPAGDASTCTVYVYTESLANAKVAGLVIQFELVADAAKSERVLDKTVVRMKTDAEGFAAITLQRNDNIQPAGTAYLVTCLALGFNKTPMTLATESFNLGDLIG